jgi:hypothetical protein
MHIEYYYSAEEILVMDSFFMKKIHELYEDEATSPGPKAFEKILRWKGVATMFQFKYILLPICFR